MTTLGARDLVVRLLETLEMARSTYDGRNNGDGGPTLMPKLYNEGSYAELERTLSEMRDNGKRCEWWHLSSRYQWGTVRRRIVRYRRTLKGPMPELPPRTELLIAIELLPKQTMRVQCYEWSERVIPRYVEAGLDYLLAEMHGGDTSRIQLPRELLYLALGKEMPDERPHASKVQTASLHPATSSG